MKIHKEGYPTLILVLSALLLVNFILFHFVFENLILKLIVIIGTLAIYFFFLQFFRLPIRISNVGQGEVICPADGEVVVIEETVEEEYFKDKRIQVSVFMSPTNVHVNWYPVSGVVKYVKYHPGKFLVAWHPKSSTLNERSTVVVETKDGKEILVRQIAGAVARRIVTYSKENTQVQTNQELGFIKFGSRVDIFLPIGTEIAVKIKDKVTGNKSLLARLL